MCRNCKFRELTNDKKERPCESLFFIVSIKQHYFVASSDTFLKFLSSFSRASETFLAL